MLANYTKLKSYLNDKSTPPNLKLHIIRNYFEDTFAKLNRDT